MARRASSLRGDMSNMFQTPAMSSTPARDLAAAPQGQTRPVRPVFSALALSPRLPINVHITDRDVLDLTSKGNASMADFDSTINGHGSARPPPDVEVSVSDDRMDRLRLWRHDALLQHQNETAIFVADKVWHMTRHPTDAFWLAQAFLQARQYARAHDLLTIDGLLDRSLACRKLAAQALIAQGKWAETLSLLDDATLHLDSGFLHRAMAGTAFSSHNRAALAKSTDGGVAIQATVLYLRGVAYLNLDNLERAKRAFQEAVASDVKCYEAFDQLFAHNLMSAKEEQEFIQGLSFAGLADDDIELVRDLYMLRLSKYRTDTLVQQLKGNLMEGYRLGDNPDVLQAEAEHLFAKCQFRKCLELTSRILILDAFKYSVLPIHLTCLHETGKRNELFLLAHDMVEKQADEPVSWLAVGIYCMAINKVADARRHFSKASVMNPRFGPAWIGFAHSFAVEGEHDQAIAAYTTAARLLQGSHLPAMFLGIQHLQLGNVVLADEYLNTALDLCQVDPLLLNELGVVCFHRNQYGDAIKWFKHAVLVAGEIGSPESMWAATYANLGHAYRRLRLFEEAADCFDRVRKWSPSDASAFVAQGTIRLHLGDFDGAIESFHRALAIRPGDTLTTDLLERALADALESHSSDC
ncbi:anaphase-promoting complex subunit Cut9 [Savitreella phatthalungensis]